MRIFKIRAIRIIYTIFMELLAFIAPLLFFSAWWMFRTWANLSMDELVFTLTSPLEGTNADMIHTFLLQCLLPAVLIFAATIILLIIFHKKRFLRITVILLLPVFLLLMLGTLYVTAKKLHVRSYLASQRTYSDFVDDNYVAPSETSILFPEQKRNLIYIFLESMEITYADEENGGAFPENVIPELTEIAQEYEDFSGSETALNGAYAMPGATWTIGAMFAQTSGLPLNISIDGNSMDTQNSFFAGAVTLGDILQSAGYSQTLLIGSDATFGGRRLYFTEHGNYDIIDYPYVIENGYLPEDYYVWWGYEDLYLFDFAKDKLLELAEQDQPFNLTMLTVDTHFEDGYVCAKCEDTYGDNQYANVMACSSRQLQEFITWIQQQDFYENTTIILAGDHPTMDSDFCAEISADYDRRTYVAYINSAVEPESEDKRIFSTFDNFPTTLAALGAQISGNRLGLGTNLFSSVPTLTETYGVEYEEQELSKRSKLIDQLANLDKNSRELLIREGIITSEDVSAEEE